MSSVLVLVEGDPSRPEVSRVRQALGEILDESPAIRRVGEELRDDSAEPALAFLFLEADRRRWRRSIRFARDGFAIDRLVAVLSTSNEQSVNDVLSLEIDELVTEIPDHERTVNLLSRLIERPECESRAELVRRISERIPAYPLVGQSEEFVREVSKIPRFASTDLPVLLQGETGTGKELFARAVHALGPQPDRPFVAVNCGCLPEGLVESELFGHEKGAFTDATMSRAGLVHEADGGTLFLDEINSLTMGAQVKLLRFLEDRQYKPLGRSSYVASATRIIAAGNLDLDRLVERGEFRSDLYYRLNALSMVLPPLREREGDAVLLARHLLESYCRRRGIRRRYLDPSTRRAIERHDWPGNVRELKNTIERAVVLSTSNILRPASVCLNGHHEPSSGGDDLSNEYAQPFRAAKQAAIDSFERRYLREILARHDANITRAARAAGKDRRSFQRLLEKHGLRHAPNGHNDET